MIAGHEIDALVAEKVMGWTTVQVPGAGKWRINGDKTISCPEALVRGYSRDIVAAWEIVERLMAPEVENEFRLIRHMGGWECTFDYFSGERAEADTAPLAICLASLRTVGVIVR